MAGQPFGDVLLPTALLRGRSLACACLREVSKGLGRTSPIRTVTRSTIAPCTYSMGYFSAKHLGAGQFYLMAIKDGKGNRLDGGHAYRLHVPASVPVHQYWSATAYDGTTHALIRNTQWSSRSSTSAGLAVNADGSVDIYFGPDGTGRASTNWVPTKACNTFEVIFRFYGPIKHCSTRRGSFPTSRGFYS